MSLIVFELNLCKSDRVDFYSEVSFVSINTEPIRTRQQVEIFSDANVLNETVNTLS